MEVQVRVYQVCRCDSCCCEVVLFSVVYDCGCVGVCVFVNVITPGPFLSRVSITRDSDDYGTIRIPLFIAGLGQLA